MRIKNGVLWLALWGALLPLGAMAEPSHLWQPTLENARRVAAQSNRLVLMYFCADWCQPCREMEQDVFGQPAAAADLQKNFVPVKVNVSYFPATAQQYGVTLLPTTVVVTPQGQALDTLRGRFEASQYVARLNQVAAGARQQGAGSIAQASTPGGPPPGAASRPDPPTADPVPPPTTRRSDDRYVDYFRRQAPAATPPLGPPPGDLALAGPGPPPSTGPAPRIIPAPQTQVPASQSPPAGPAAAPPSPNPPLALDGYCPVRLVEHKEWVSGDRRWGLRHRGRTYLFSGPEERARFYADPDRYAPVLSGNDVVLAVERNQTVPGHRAYGVFFASKVYLFADRASLEKFEQNPRHYASQMTHSPRAGAYPGGQLR